MRASTSAAGRPSKGVGPFFGFPTVLSGVVTMDDPRSEAAEDLRDINAALAGDENAYARLVRRYQPLVFRQMFRFTRERMVLDELVQEVFVEAYFSLKSYRAKAPFLHWLRRIATRVGYRHWKRAARLRRIDDAAREAGAEPSARSEEPSDAAAVIFGYLERLAPPDRLVLTLLYLDECDNDEIAARTGWSRTLVRVRAHRARNRLKKILEDEGFTL